MQLSEIQVGQQIQMPNRKRVELFTVKSVSKWEGHNTHQGVLWLIGPRGAIRQLFVTLDGRTNLQ